MAGIETTGGITGVWIAGVETIGAVIIGGIAGGITGTGTTEVGVEFWTIGLTVTVILIGDAIIGFLISGLIIDGGIVAFLIVGVELIIGFSIVFAEFLIVGRGVFGGFGFYGIDVAELFFEVDRFEKNVVVKIGNCNPAAIWVESLDTSIVVFID